MNPDTLHQNYAKAFRVIRAAFGLRQADLADRMPITASQLSLIEAGKRQPSLRVVNSLASAVGVPPALITLLASTTHDVESKPNEHIAELAKMLLRLLVTANDDPRQRPLAFKSNKT